MCAGKVVTLATSVKATRPELPPGKLNNFALCDEAINNTNVEVEN